MITLEDRLLERDVRGETELSSLPRTDKHTHVTELGISVIHGAAGPLTFLTEQARLQARTWFSSLALCLFFTPPISFSLFGSFPRPLSPNATLPKQPPCTQVDVEQSINFNFGPLFFLPFNRLLSLLCVFTDDLLGKRRSFSPNSSSDCPSDSKKSRSVSPKGRSTQSVCVLWHC